MNWIAMYQIYSRMHVDKVDATQFEGYQYEFTLRARRFRVFRLVSWLAVASSSAATLEYE